MNKQLFGKHHIHFSCSRTIFYSISNLKKLTVSKATTSLIMLFSITINIITPRIPPENKIALHAQSALKANSPLIHKKHKILMGCASAMQTDKKNLTVKIFIQKLDNHRKNLTVKIFIYKLGCASAIFFSFSFSFHLIFLKIQVSPLLYSKASIRKV